MTRTRSAWLRALRPRSTPRFCGIRSWLRGFARRCGQRRSLRRWNCAAPVLACECMAKRLCEPSRDRAQAFTPVRQRERELMRQRCGYSANAVWKLGKVARLEYPVFKQIDKNASTFARTGSIASSARESLCADRRAARQVLGRAHVRAVRGVPRTPNTRTASSS